MRNDDDDDDDENEGQGRRKKDMVAELLEAEEGFSEEEMVDFLLALLVAGYETTPTIMTLAVKFVTDNPPALSLLAVSHHIHHHLRMGCTLSLSPSGDALVFILLSRESKWIRKADGWMGACAGRGKDTGLAWLTDRSRRPS